MDDAPRTQCSDAVRRAIYGDASDKAAQYDASLQRWWKEYAARKNDEEEEHVADSLLYDERCTLPRTVQRPDFQSDARSGENAAGVKKT